MLAESAAKMELYESPGFKKPKIRTATYVSEHQLAFSNSVHRPRYNESLQNLEDYEVFPS